MTTDNCTDEKIATIFNIQPFSTQDGPGVRTTIFFKGCNLRCAWCHNPESLSAKPQLQMTLEKCIGCGRCFTACKYGALSHDHVIDRERCVSCGLCANVCCARALTMVGVPMTVGAVVRQVLSDKPYYGKDGGITVSGGECLLYPKFVFELLSRCKAAGLTTAIDTAGNVDFAVIEQLIPVTDYFLYDVKAVDSDLHKQLTGSDNTQILHNLALLLPRTDTSVIVRIPCIPGANFHDIKNAVALFEAHKPLLVELLPYHRLGEGKAAAFNRDFTAFDVPQKAEMDDLVEHFTKHLIPVCCT